jgi:hypothetical protein
MAVGQPAAGALADCTAATTETARYRAEQHSAYHPDEQDAHGTEHNDAESLRNEDQG